MSTVQWTNPNGTESKTHLLSISSTLCGIETPFHLRHSFSVYGIADCKRCLKAEEKRNAEKVA